MLCSIYSMLCLLKSHLSIHVRQASQSNLTWAYPQTEEIRLTILTTAKFQSIFTGPGVPITFKQVFRVTGVPEISNRGSLEINDTHYQFSIKTLLSNGKPLIILYNRIIWKPKYFKSDLLGERVLLFMCITSRLMRVESQSFIEHR